MSGHRYLVVVPTSERVLYEHLCARFRGDERTRVLLDRRRPAGREHVVDRSGRERRADSRKREVPGALGCHGVVVLRLDSDVATSVETPRHGTNDGEEATPMQDGEMLEDRQRVDRWLEESQYLIGRLIPGFLDDRDRLRTKLDSVEQDRERLRLEVVELRRQVAGLESDLQFYRNEQAAAAETFAGIVEHLTALQKPVGDLFRRMQTAHPIGAATEVHA